MEPLVLTSAPSSDCAAAAAPLPVRRERRQPSLARFLSAMPAGSWIAFDWLIIGLAAAAMSTWLVNADLGFEWLANRWLVSLSFCGGVTLAGLAVGLYDHDTLLSRSRLLVRLTLALALGVMVAFALLSVFFYASSSRWVALAVVLTYLLVGLPLRLWTHDTLTRARVRVLCIGEGDSTRKLVALLARSNRPHYEIVGHTRLAQGALRLVAANVDAKAAPRFRTTAELAFSETCPYLGTIDDIEEQLIAYEIDEVVVGSELAHTGAVGPAVATCLQQRCRVTDHATFVESLLGEVPVENITAEWFLRADVQNRGNFEAVKRCGDALAAGFGLLITLPLWPLIALAIRLDSRGPALYRQVRVGARGRCFTIYKFRTMRTDAEKDGVRWAAANDGRVTRLGRFLRKSRLDELPQLWNILRGDMSLVGPRPERPEFVHNLEQLLPHYRLRHLVRPGLTGWAQIHYGYGASVADAHRKLCYDLYYLKHRSLELDVAILIRTLGTFVLGAR